MERGAHGTGPTRRRLTCGKDSARAEIDRVRDRRWKQRDTASEQCKTKENESDRYSHDTSETLQTTALPPSPLYLVLST